MVSSCSSDLILQGRQVTWAQWLRLAAVLEGWCWGGDLALRIGWLGRVGMALALSTGWQGTVGAHPGLWHQGKIPDKYYKLILWSMNMVYVATLFSVAAKRCHPNWLGGMIGNIFVIKCLLEFLFSESKYFFAQHIFNLQFFAQYHLTSK